MKIDIRARLDTLEALKQDRVQVNEDIGIVTEQIKQQLEEDDAVLYEDDGWVAEIKAPTKWNEEALIPLLEHYDSEEIKSLQNKVAIPKFNKTKLTKEAKKGGEIKRIIDFAKQEGTPELTIRQKVKKRN